MIIDHAIAAVNPNAAPPPGTEVKFLFAPGDWRPSILDAVVVTGTIYEPADLACKCIVRAGRDYHRVYDYDHINPTEQTLKVARRRWAARVIAKATVNAVGIPEWMLTEAEAIWRGEA